MRLLTIALITVLLSPAAHAIDLNDPCERLGGMIFLHAFGYFNATKQAYKMDCFEDPPPADGYSPQCERVKEKGIRERFDAYWVAKEEWYARNCQTGHCLQLDFLNAWGREELDVDPYEVCRSK